MSALAGQFGPALLVAALAAPLVVLAAFLAPGLRGLARAVSPLAALPALAAAVLTIGGAALDVTDPEPLPAGHPLWDLPNCLITPHTADTEEMTQALLADRIAENIKRLADGRELAGLVDPELGY